MKIAYLVLAHNNFKHLDRLIDILDDGQAAFFIHLDKKVSETYTPQNSKAAIIGKKINIKWGGFSMIEATLALMDRAVADMPDADYYILISGVDYPIRPAAFLNNLLLQQKEYIDIAPLPVPYKPEERYTYYYFDYNRRNLKYYNPFFILEKVMKRLKIKRKSPFKIYVGTQWFALTGQCVRYILDTIRDDKRYEQFFRHTLVPDEAFFQTIIGNSPFRENTAASLVYTDWEVPVPPAIMGDHHVDFLKTTFEFNDEYGKRFPYFARKFDDQSEQLLQKIDKELRV